jgi:hypothetical protein
MMISTLLLSSTLLALPAAAPQDPSVDKPEPAEQPAAEIVEIEPEEAAAEIKEALKSKEEIVMVAALQNLGQVPSKLVTKEVYKGLKIKKPTVQQAAIEALRYNEDPTALSYLLKVRREKSIQEDPKSAEAYAYALGQKGDRKAIDALTDDLIGTSTTPTSVIKAKVLALGHIRHKDSVEAIFDYNNTTVWGGRRRGGVRKISRESQIALSILTGQDFGDSRDSWIGWWSDNKSKFKMSETEWPLDNERAQRAWTKLWMTPKEKEEAKKKEEEKKAKRKKESGPLECAFF